MNDIDLIISERERARKSSLHFQRALAKTPVSAEAILHTVKQYAERQHPEDNFLITMLETALAAAEKERKERYAN